MLVEDGQASHTSFTTDGSVSSLNLNKTMCTTGILKQDSVILNVYIKEWVEEGWKPNSLQALGRTRALHALMTFVPRQSFVRILEIHAQLMSSTNYE